MKRGFAAFIIVIAILLVCGASYAGRGERGEEVRKTFEGIEKIDLESVSGDCVVKTHGSSEVVVELFYDVDPEGSFKYKMRESGHTLVLKERWGRGSSSGEVLWTLTVPAGTKIDFSSASGDLSVEGLKGGVESSTASGDIELHDMGGDIEISTASGDIEINGCKGDVEASTASGDIMIEDCTGEIELSTASGDIDAERIGEEIKLSTASGDVEVSDSKGVFNLGCASGSVTAKNIVVTDESSFSTASGEVEVSLAGTAEYDLELSSASGDVVLDYNGNPVKGYFEFEAKKRGGRIVCPFDFDKEEEYEHYDQVYMRKSFSLKGDTPHVYLSTSSGKAVLKK